MSSNPSLIADTATVRLAMAPCTFDTITSAAEFEPLGAEWDALVRDDAPAEPVPAPRVARRMVAPVRHGCPADGRSSPGATDKLVGAAPLFIKRSGGLRVARFLGGHESALADLLLAEGEDESTALGLRPGAAEAAVRLRRRLRTARRLGVRTGRRRQAPPRRACRGACAVDARRLGRRLLGQDELEEAEPPPTPPAPTRRGRRGGVRRGPHARRARAAAGGGVPPARAALARPP